MSGHAPGPWLFSMLGDWERPQDVYVHAFGWGPVAQLHLDPSLPNIDKQRANLHLIGAAPDLLEALTAVLKKGSRWHPCDPVVVAARAAIAKATGATP